MLRRLIRSLIAVGLAAATLFASEQQGVVTFGGLPVPGAIVTAIQGEKKYSTVTDAQGKYVFPDLADGMWSIEVEMPGFTRLKNEITVAPGATASAWELKMLPLAEMHAETQLAAPKPATPAVAAAPPGPAEESKPEAKANQAPPARDEMAERAADGLLINGSQNNAASSPFALFPAFGNNRNGSRSLYNGGLGIFDNNSIWDARTFSLTGQATPKPAYNLFTGSAYFGGPLRIPHLLRNGPNFFVNYSWTRNSTAANTPALMPTEAQREGQISPTLTIPKSEISPQALALLTLYPLPNFPGGQGYNYQVPIVSNTHQDSLQSRLNQTFDRKNTVFGGLAFQDTRQATPNVFGFVDTTDSLGLHADAHWFHRFAQGLFGNFGFDFSRFSMNLHPNFENLENVSGAAGIVGNDQSPLDWGPPTLGFSSGIAGLTDGEQAINHNETNSVSAAFYWNRGRHNFQFGGDFKRQQFNVLGQNNGHGTFDFTGQTTGSDFGDFLAGIPDVVDLAFGNADKYFRDSLYDVYFTDDWRMTPSFTLNAGMRWEYGSPVTELYGRLVNLDVTPGFSNEAPVVASDPIGSLTGMHYPDSLIRPDKRAFEPRVALAWRPLAASSLVVRAGYGIYYDTSVYETLATQMSQQFPLSKSLSFQNTTGLTMANAFNATPASTPETFGIDPNFRPGYAQNWQASVQRDLPGSLQMTVTYLGIKGTHGTQEFLPNTYPAGAINPCPLCPFGYEYVKSNGNSTREAGEIQLRRRLYSGFTATVQYTYAKAIDDDAVLGGVGAGASSPVGSAIPSAPTAAPARSLAVAQNWLDLSAERGLSTFDQRHLLSASIQYTTGVGAAGGTLLSGWRGALFKGWLLSTTISAGTGFPLTPQYVLPQLGTGFTNALRPEYTGQPLYAAPPGLALNPAAFAAPLPGQYGDAGRDSITGPFQFTLNASAGRTFRLTDRFSGDLRIDSTNPLNYVEYTAWNTVFGNRQFGLPVSAGAMRSLTTGFIVRF
jgi:trimeric autotransporter adhesin